MGLPQFRRLDLCQLALKSAVQPGSAAPHCAPSTSRSPRSHPPAGAVKDARFHVVEFRGFEKFCEGRSFREMPVITARICGICPIAYQMSSVHAMEAACGVTVGGPLRELRRLLYCGEWIESHVLHIAMLHAPDFLGYEDAIRMAKDHPEIVKGALKLKKTGNAIVSLLGGREIHPINVRLGGFHRAPTARELRALVEMAAVEKFFVPVLDDANARPEQKDIGSQEANRETLTWSVRAAASR